MAGILYGIGVGPGDPDLLTLKAVKKIKNSNIIALPGKSKEGCTAYQIAVQAVPELKEMECICLPVVMTKDQERLKESYDTIAVEIESYLKEGKDVGFLTIGDPAVYSTYLYVQERVMEHGYSCEMISGIPSFCAAAAKLLIGLGMREEAIHIIPASYLLEDLEKVLQSSGTKVLMKSGKKMKEVKDILKKMKLQVSMIENCGMADEKIYYGVDEIPDDAGYFSLLIIRE